MPEELNSAPEFEAQASASAETQADVSEKETQSQGADTPTDPLEDIWEKHQGEAEDTPAADKEQPGAVEGKPEGQKPDAAADQKGQDEAGKAAPDASTAIPAPNTWTKEEKAAWDAAPPEVKAALVRRASQVEQLAKDSLEARNFARVMEPIGHVLADPETQEFFKTLQMPDGTRLAGNPKAIAAEIRDLIGIKRTLITNPAEGMRQISQWLAQWGLDPGQIPQAENGQEQNPQMSALQRELAQLRAVVARREKDSEEATVAAQQQHAVQRIAHTVVGFTEAKDATGNHLYPHLHGEHAEAVGEAMGRWLRANVGPEGLTPELMQRAYDTAVFAHPGTREAEFKRREEKRVAEFKSRSDRARKAAGLRPNPGGPASGFEKMTAQEAMEAVWNKHQGA